MNKKTPLIVFVASMLVLAACAGQPTPTPTSEGAPAVQDTPASGGQSTDSMGEVMIDPAQTVEGDAQTVIGHVYETLVKVQDEALAPSLAASIIPSEDGLAYTVNLRPGVKFHDGSFLNADAVIANFNRWFDPADSARGSGTYDAWLAAFNGFKGETDADGKAKSTFDGAEKVNETTVILHLNTPDSDFISKLSNPAFSIVNPAAFSAAGFGTLGGMDGGTGPYMVSEHTESSLTLAPFADYWNPSAAASGNLEFSLGK